jgi:hypothetical protein
MIVSSGEDGWIQMLPTSDYLLARFGKALYQRIEKRFRNPNRLPLVAWTHLNLMRRQLSALKTSKWLSLLAWLN